MQRRVAIVVDVEPCASQSWHRGKTQNKRKNQQHVLTTNWIKLTLENWSNLNFRSKTSVISRIEKKEKEKKTNTMPKPTLPPMNVGDSVTAQISGGMECVRVIVLL